MLKLILIKRGGEGGESRGGNTSLSSCVPLPLPFRDWLVRRGGLPYGVATCHPLIGVWHEGLALDQNGTGPFFVSNLLFNPHG